MKKVLVRFIVSLAIMVFGLGIVSAPATYAAGATSNQCNEGFLTFPAWYRGLTDPDTCEIKEPKVKQDNEGLSKFIWTIVLNVIEIGLQLVGYAAVGYIIYGGFKYLTSSGSADRVTSARKIIFNAVIGLVISILSVAIVNIIATRL